jgi:anhydro-N-acetylmuramic acid kinase
MSGTSADGVDVALVRIAGRELSMTATLVCQAHRPYSSELRKAIFHVRSAGSVALAELARVGREITLVYAQAVKELLNIAHIDSSEIAAIAAHGQTLFHDPPLTLQWLDPSLLAYETGSPIVSDFRRADCAAGGQGAPLVPFADYILFRRPDRTRVLLNLGGIANLTFLRGGGTFDETIAFDTGPANCLSDWLMRTRDPAGPGFDADGLLAQSGKSVKAIVDKALAYGFFVQSPPKSTDTPTMLAMYQGARGAAAAAPSLQDELATAAAIVAESIIRAIRSIEQQVGRATQELLISGGGVRNAAIMQRLRAGMAASCSVTPIESLGIPSDAKEAVAFALLGAATLDGLPGNVPSVTGACRPVVLGSLTKTSISIRNGGS